MSTRCPDWPHSYVCTYCGGNGCRHCGRTGELSDTRPCSHDTREGSLGTLPSACAILGVDEAGLRAAVAAGTVLAERDGPSQPWVFFRART